MLESMNAIRGYQSKHIEDTAGAFAADLLVVNDQGLPGEDVAKIDAHRRIVGNYFHKVATLVEANIVDEKVIRGAWNSGLVPFFEDVLFPLELGKARSLVLQNKMSEASMKDAQGQLARRSALWRRLLMPPPSGS